MWESQERGEVKKHGKGAWFFCHFAGFLKAYNYLVFFMRENMRGRDNNKL